MTPMLLFQNLTCLLFLTTATLLYGCLVTLPLVLFHPLLGMRLDEAMRRHNKRYGALVIGCLRPLVRVERIGLSRVPRPGPCVIVANHRSFADIFFFALIPLQHVSVVARSWPFRLPLAGLFMRLAGYVDIERESIDDLLGARGSDLLARGASILFFPEGHRSRDGRLRRFQSGAFLYAAHHNLPLVPVCLAGTEQITPKGSWLLRPARVTMEFLPPLWPEDYPAEKRALKLKHAAEARFREYFHE